jgi:hypothetical protein
MATYLALPLLYTATVAAFAAEDDWDDVAFAFGWREPARQNAGLRRIVYTPGNRGGGLGKLQPPREVGGHPERHLQDLAELFTVILTAGLDGTLTDELAAYKAARELFDHWWATSRVLVTTNLAIIDARWLNERANEVRRGATLEVVGAILSPIPDAQKGTAPVDTAAEIATKLGETTSETMFIEPE